MHQLASIRAVAFDIDGTLYTTASMYRASAWLVLSNLRLYRAFGRAREAVRDDPPADLWRRTVQLTAERLGADAGETEARIRAIVYDAWEARLSSVRLVAGLRELVAWLEQRGLRTALLSDFPVARKLGILGIDDLFPTRLSAEDVGRLKPHPEPFLALCRLLEVAPHEVLYVGNSYRNDVLGATAAGMAAVHLARRPRRDTPALATVRDFVALQRWLAANLEPRRDPE